MSKMYSLKLRYLILLILFSPQLSEAQNLIRNGGFEDVKSCDLNRHNAFVSDSPPWYNAGGTPDIFQFNCDKPALFESEFHRPHTGEVFAAIGGGPSEGGYHFFEGIGIELTEPLEQGKNYILEFYLRVYRFGAADSVPVNNCVTSPQRQLNVYLSEQQFNITHTYENFLLADSYTNGRLIYADSSHEIIPPYTGVNGFRFYVEDIGNPWHKISICIHAKGGERYLGITGPHGPFTTVPGCQGTTTRYAGHYFNIDDVSLLKYPEDIELSDTICIDEPNEIDLSNIIDEAYGEPTFYWSDGFPSTVRNVTQPGVENIEAYVGCDTMNVTLELEGVDCMTRIFVPNAFTPNNYDGINDELQPFIQNYWEISNYEFKIFDRWGQLLFKTNDINAYWDGTYNGQVALKGIYIWSIEYEQIEDGELKSYIESGDVLLMK